MPRRQEMVPNSIWELSERQSKQEMPQEWGGGQQGSFSRAVCLETLLCARALLLKEGNVPASRADHLVEIRAL